MSVSSFRGATKPSGFDRCHLSPAAAIWALLLMLLATAAAGQPPAGAASGAAAQAPARPSAGAAPSTGAAQPPAAPSTDAIAASTTVHPPAGPAKPAGPSQNQNGSGGQQCNPADKAASEPLFAVGWGALYLLLVVAFFFLAAQSDLLRSGPIPNGGARRPFSLARCQAAWWLFVVVGSYLLIGVTTGCYLNAITATALVLMGISAGVTVAAATVDSAQQDAAGQVRRQSAIATAQAEVQVVQDQILPVQRAADQAVQDGAAKAAQAKAAADLAARLTGSAAVPAHAAAKEVAKQAKTAAEDAVAAIAKRKTAEAGLADKVSRLKAARNETETFWLDILSDADGVTVHRFQNVVWTVVLGFVFVILTCTHHAMPVFDNTLLTLMGISGGTYVGLKVPEAKVPS
jgi:hypothetical protein